jgi:flagellar biosynthesis protein FliR
MNTTYLDISLAQFQVFLLMFVRTLGVLSVAPIFGHRVVINQSKAGFAFALALALFPAMPVTIAMTSDLAPFVASVVKEIAMGMMFGFVARLVFVAVQFAGELVGIDIGFGVVNVIDPLSAEQISIIGTFKNLIAMVTFLMIDGHHVILQALSESFAMVPLGGVQLSEMLAKGLIEMTAQVFGMAVKLAAPVVTSLFMTSVALGIMARTMPQMNVFIVGFPLKIAVGMGMMAMTLPLFQTILIKMFHELGPNLSILLQQMYKP